MCGAMELSCTRYEALDKAFEGYTRLTNPLDSNYDFRKWKARNHIGLIHQTMTVPTQNNSIPGMV